MGSKLSELEEGFANVLEITDKTFAAASKVSNAAHFRAVDDKPVGEKQSHFTKSGNPKTTLNLGEAVKDPKKYGLEAPFGYPGVSLDTVKHFYANIGEEAVFQIGKNATFQSGERWNHFAKSFGAAYDETAMISAGGSLLLAAGPVGRYLAPGPSGKELSAPEFMGASVHALLAHHFVLGDDFEDESIDDTNQIRELLGLHKLERGPEDWRKKFKKFAKSFDRLSHVMYKVTQTAHTVSGLIDTTAGGMKKFEKWHEKNKAAGDDILIAAAGLAGGATIVMAPLMALSKEARAGAVHVAASPHDKGMHVLGQLGAYANDFKAGTDMVATSLHGLSETKRESEEYAKQKDHSATAKAAHWAANVAIWAKTADKFLSDAMSAVAGHAFAAAFGGKPQVHIAAEDDVHITSGKLSTFYSTKGFSLLTDEGGFLLDTHESVDVKCQGSTEIVAGDHLLLEARKGAELAGQGPVAVGSREKSTEILGAKVVLGSIESEKTQRNRDHAQWGSEWDHTKQQPTTHLAGSAKEQVTLHVADKALGEDESPTLNSNVDAAVKLDAKEKSTDLWAKEKIRIVADQDKGTVKMYVGMFVIEVNQDKIMMGQSETAKDPTPKEPLLSIDKKGFVTLKSKGASLVLDNNSEGCLSARRGKSEVRVNGGGTWINGSKINIG